MSKSKSSTLRTLRVVCACVVFSLFVLLMLDLGGVFHKYLAFLPKIQFWPAVLATNIAVLVLLIVLTLVFGRVYCSFLCPLGIMQDGLIGLRSKFAGKLFVKKGSGYMKPLEWLRRSVLLVFLVLATLGYGSVAYLIEPYSVFGLVFTGVVSKSAVMILISLGIVFLFAVLTYRRGRIWCNTICPVGSLLGLLSKRSLFRPTIHHDACTKCGLCAKQCRAACINPAEGTIDLSTCVMCFDCIDACHSGAIKYDWFLKKDTNECRDGSNSAETPTETHTETSTENSPETSAENGGMDRRAFLGAAAMIAGTATLRAQQETGDGALGILLDKEAPARKTPIVPAGAGSFKIFSHKCVGCQLCVSACPNQVLRPSLNSENILQPVMSFEKGFCRPECTACADVCPTGAIRKVTREEKTSISIGHAVFIPSNCISVTDAVKCGNCARHCPAGAIRMVKQEGDYAFGFDENIRIPSINAERCIGCGHCEYVCPSRPFSAIYVEGNEVHRNI